MKSVRGTPTVSATDSAAAWEQFVSDWQGRAGGTYLSVGKRFLRWLEPSGVGLAEVTPDIVRRFLDGLGVKPHSKGVYRSGLRALFDALAAHGSVAKNPVLALSGGAGAANASTDGQPTLAELKFFLRYLDDYREGDPFYRAGLVAMYPIVVGGMDTQAIASFTGIPIEEVETNAARLRDNGIWTPDGKIAVDFDDPASDEAAVNLILMIGCAGGLFARVAAEGNAPDQPAEAASQGAA
jgi:hypothetical protein